MVEPILTLTAGAVLSYAIPKLLDASIAKVGESLTEGAIAKIRQAAVQLRQKIWDRLRGHHEAEQALTAAESGSQDDLQRITNYLQGIFDREPQFVQELHPLVQDIEQTINIAAPNARNLQQNFAGSQGLMAPDANGPIIQAKDSPINIQYNTSPKH